MYIFPVLVENRDEGNDCELKGGMRSERLGTSERIESKSFHLRGQKLELLERRQAYWLNSVRETPAETGQLLRTFGGILIKATLFLLVAEGKTSFVLGGKKIW